MLGNRNKRRGDRYATARDIVIAIDGDGTPRPATLMDVSPTGFKVHVEAGIAVGAKLMLSVPGFPDLAAHAMWRRDGLIGCAFTTPLSRHSVIAMARSGMFGSTASPSA